MPGAIRTERIKYILLVKAEFTRREVVRQRDRIEVDHPDIEKALQTTLASSVNHFGGKLKDLVVSALSEKARR